MKYTSVLLSAVLLPTFVASNSFFGSQKTLDETLAVPGKNPLKFCNDPKDDILAIEKVDLTPNPPAAGDLLIIEATGTLGQDVVKGSYVHLEVKYGLITLIKTTADLCGELESLDNPCPLKKGPITIKKEINITDKIPPGTYAVLADVWVEGGDQRITCLETQVSFGR